jgi:predicted RecB family nuclease
MLTCSSVLGVTVVSAKKGSKYPVWEKANQERKSRQKFCDILEKKYPADHVEVKEARRKLAEAIAEYDRLVGEL